MELDKIRERDAGFGEDIPSHWQAQLDRRFLLKLVDELKESNGCKESCCSEEIPR